MIDAKFIDFISGRLGIQRKEMIEKDIILQTILYGLAKNEAFVESFAFKGGTCLTKVYFGYYRFSEDLDFTYLHQKDFAGKSQKKIRALLSEKVAFLNSIFEAISKNMGLEFAPAKEDKKYIEFGGSNKFVTFKFWYKSVVLKQDSFVKIQISFVEKLDYPVVGMPIEFILRKKDNKEVRFLFPDYAYLFDLIKINAYDLREILEEKIRAIVTRRGIKARDFVDVFLITGKGNFELGNFKDKIIQKIRFMLRYEKYQQNIKDKANELSPELILGEEQKLLLIPISKGFPSFVKELDVFLKEIIKELDL